MSNRDIPLKFFMARVFGIYTTTAIVNTSQTEVTVPVTSSTSYKSVIRSYYCCYNKCLEQVNIYMLDTLSIILVI